VLVECVLDLLEDVFLVSKFQLSPIRKDVLEPVQFVLPMLPGYCPTAPLSLPSTG
jgi:hypothetical protein